MTDTKEVPVWYAAYGSNLLRERFMAYISGGQYGPTARMHRGCSDKHPPIDEHTVIINRQLYFSRSSMSWNGGVAFLGTEESAAHRTYCRCYLLTFSQFTGIALQENDLDPHSVRHCPDYDELVLSGTALLMPGRTGLWYNRIIMCGSYRGYPVLTITGEKSGEETGFTKPGAEYIRIIMRGLAESWGLDREQIVSYLEHKSGISGAYDRSDLMDIADTI